MRLSRAGRFSILLLGISLLFNIASAQENEGDSISGQLLMLDDKTPHVATAVQLVTASLGTTEPPQIIATVLSDERGGYKFHNLKPGRYHVRCYTKDGYIYYQHGKILHVERDNVLLDIDFRFAPFKRGVWRTDTSVDGFAGNYGMAIYQDIGGFIWLGTSDGLFRYDGKIYQNLSTQGGLSAGVLTIHRDRDGIMWFGTRGGGVSRYNGKTFQNFTTKDGLASNTVWAIHEAVNGVMWFGTGYLTVEGEGISRYDGKTFQNFTTEDGLASNTVFSIDEDVNGTLWFGTNSFWSGVGGISRYDGSTFTTITTEDGLVSNMVTAIHRAPDGAMWIGSYAGVSRYDGKTFQNFTAKDGLVHPIVQSIGIDPSGDIWFGTWGGGVSRFDGTGWINYTIKDGLTDNVVNAIHCSSDGNIWFATNGGVTRYNEREFVNLTQADGLVSKTITVIRLDSLPPPEKPSAMWLATLGGGIAYYDGKEITCLTTGNGLAHNDVSVMDVSPDGALWCGTFGGGLSRYKDGKFKEFTRSDGLAHTWIYSLYCDPAGVVWIGTAGRGISRYDGNIFATFDQNTHGLAHNWVPAIGRDWGGTMWFGTGGGGVSRFDGQEFVNLTTEDGLGNNWINAIYPTSDGMIWFGTASGISLYDGERFSYLTVSDGLPNNNVNAFHRDRAGVMWVATNGGVCWSDGTAWTSVSAHDGLGSDRVSSIAQDADGRFWFGTRGGLTRYTPLDTVPRVRILSVQTDQTYIWGERIPPISAGHRVTIVYSAIDFKTVPQKRQYRVRITGIDPDWRKPTRSDTFDHAFENPGTYTFSVQAIDRDLNYSEPASVTLKVVLPLYKRAAFLVPTVGGGGLLLVLVIIQAAVLLKRRRQVQAYQRLAMEELADARRVQMGLMPEVAPKIEGLSIAGKCVSATEVSGDFFDYLLGEEENEIAIVVGDVTGHGMQGAMNAVMVDGVLRMAAEKSESLASGSLMGDLNNVLVTRLEEGMNVTMVIGAINADTKVLHLANAGHHAHPLLLRSGTVSPLVAKGMPLGMLSGISYRPFNFDLQSGDVLVLMTDGIIEANDPSGLQYQQSGRLEQMLAQFTSDTSVEAMVEALINDVTTFGENMTAEEEDDITVVVVKVL